MLSITHCFERFSRTGVPAASSGALLAVVLLGLPQPANAQQTRLPQETPAASRALDSSPTGEQALLGTSPRLTIFIAFETEPLEKVTQGNQALIHQWEHLALATTGAVEGERKLIDGEQALIHRHRPSTTP